jgi:hypothetical protein
VTGVSVWVPPVEAPAVRLAGLTIWIHGADGSWLRATAHCADSSAVVWVSGSILWSDGFAAWRDQLQAMYDTLSGEAALDSPEPELRVHLVFTDGVGHLRIRVDITPDCFRQAHRFDFEADQSYLPSLIEQCRALLSRYPVRASESSAP